VAAPRPWPAGWQVSGNRQVIRRKGTAASTGQKNRRCAESDRVPGEITIPEQVVVSMGSSHRAGPPWGDGLPAGLSAV